MRLGTVETLRVRPPLNHEATLLVDMSMWGARSGQPCPYTASSTVARPVPGVKQPVEATGCEWPVCEVAAVHCLERERRRSACC